MDEAKAAADADGGVKSTVDLGLGPEQIDRVDTLSTAYRQEKDYQSLQQLRSEYTRAVATYERIRQQPDGSDPDIETGVMDIALINIFQRMIDPGVSVREGDVQLLQSASGLAAKIGLWGSKIFGAGEKLPKEARAEMFQLATDYYREAMVKVSKELSSRYRTKIDIDGLLKESGVDVRDLGTDFYEEYGRTLEPRDTAPPDDAEPGDPDAPVPGLTPDTNGVEDDDSLMGAPGSPRREENLAAIAQDAVDKGWTVADLQKAIITYYTSKGQQVNEDFLVRVLQRFDELSGDDEEPPVEEPDAEQ